MWPSAVTKHVPASPGDGATYEIHVHGTSPGRPRVTNTCGVKSPSMWPSAVTKHVPASPGDGATYEIHVHGTSPGRPRVTFVHVLPPSRVTWRFPSSVPTHTTFGSRGDSPMAYTVQWFSAPELSTDRPPDLSCCSFAGSFVVRSGEIFSHVSPLSRVRYRNCAPM